MAITKVIEIVAKTEQALKDIKDLYNEQIDLQKDAIKEQDKLNKEVEDLGKSAKDSKKGLEAIKSGVSGIGLAFKALGIGLIISAFNTLKDVFLSNQTIADGFATVMETVNIVFNKTVGVLIESAKYAYEVTGGFDALGKVLSGLLTLGITPLKVAFFQIQKAITVAQLAWEKSFFGDGDPETIKQLNKELLETNNNLKQVGEDALNAGLDIVNNFSEAVGEVSTLANKTIEGVKEISLSASFEQAKSITQNKKNFELLALQQQRLQLQYQRDAEKLRQIRDNDQLSIEKRIEANDKLAETLKKQGDAEAGTIKARISALLQEQNALGVTAERTNEIYQLNTDLIDLNERLAGQESEQLTNKNGLLKEQIDLNNTISDAEKERRIAQLEFDANQEQTELGKLEKQRLALDEENKIIAEDLERKKELFALGTQARVDAEQEFLTKSQEINNRLLENKKQIGLEEIKNDQVVAEAKEKIRDANINNISAGIGLLKDLAGKSEALQAAAVVAENAVGVGKTIINTQAANSAVTAKYALLPGGVALAAAERTANNISAGISIASSVLATKNALSQLKGGSASAKGGSVGNSGGGGSQAPSFNLVQGTGTNQIAEGLQSGNEPIQAYVVSSNVSTAQSLDRNIIDEASI